MNKIIATLLGCLLICATTMWAQTANDNIKPYDEPFRPGVNLGYFPGLSNENLADLAAGNADKNVQGLGAKSIRTGIFNEFVEVWGYNFLEETYDYFEERGLKENTVIVGFPAAWQRDQTFHCPDKQSTMFANLYDPIFDNGENGTPVNDNNYLALYLYKLVSEYKDHVRFWEIWNEPGSDLPTGFQVGWRQPGTPGNWWDNNPDPCDNILHAPIYQYVRTLRVAYEVIKSVDPDAYVSVAGFGYPAFLDAVLRNTDNPVDGSPTQEYPLGGGAYFDVFGNHAYPHFDGSTTNFDEGRFERHSDRAADGIVTRRIEFEEVLAKYGYDGETYPLKPSIITEVNVPRKRFGDNLGGIDVQINYIIKAFIKAKTNNVYVIHPYNLIERDDYETAESEFGVMGMYERFDTPGGQVPTGEAIAYKTTADLLYSTTYDVAQTAAMMVPEGVRGHAFKRENGDYVYALWAETSVDLSEEGSATYSFPMVMNVGDLSLIQWDNAQNETSSLIGSNNIPLDARPIFLLGGGVAPVPPMVPDTMPDPIDTIVVITPIDPDTSTTPTPIPPTSNGTNLAITLSATDDQPGIYNTTTLTLTVSNTGAMAATDIFIQMPLSTGEWVYTEHETTAGRFINWNGNWLIPAIAAGSSQRLTVNVYTLKAEPLAIFAQVVSIDQLDNNSTPDNGVCCIPREDDEAVLTLNKPTECICTTEVAPVCGSNGVTYSNACLAVCAGVIEYTAGECSSTTGLIDLNLEMLVDKSNFLIYETVTTSLILKNEGTDAARNIKIELEGYQDELAYAFHATSAGEFVDWVGDWQIPVLAAGETATLDLGLFTLQDSQPHTIFAQVVSASPVDVDSNPANNDGLVPAEDDEAAVTIVPSNNLNGNTAEFRNKKEQTQSFIIQQLLPNPATDQLNVRVFSKINTAVSMKVLNPQGQVMMEQRREVTAGVNFAQITVDDLPAGMYFILLEGTGSRLQPLRFVKQRL